MSRALLIVTGVALVIASMPLWLPRMSKVVGVATRPAPAWLPMAAAFLFLASFWLPDIRISTETQTFQQHFVGGGLFCAALYAYGRRLYGLRLTWWQDLAALIAVVSTLGVAAELGEFALTHLGLARIGTGDTDWDLLANTTGALSGWACAHLMGRLRPTGPKA